MAGVWREVDAIIGHDECSAGKRWHIAHVHYIFDLINITN